MEVNMLAKVQKWGNSLALRLPKILAEETNLQIDSAVEITVRDHTIVIKPIQRKGTYDLDQLLSEVTQENCHVESDFGGPTGREVW
jgi:antitoxin MazE